MLRKNLKYALIVVVNALALTFLLGIWFDKVEYSFRPYAILIECIKILGISIACLLGIYILIRKLKNNNRYGQHKIQPSILICLVISSLLYIPYTIRVWDVSMNESRKNLSNKIVQQGEYPNGSKAEHLTWDEYSIIVNTTWLPEISQSAREISYEYYYDGFLPDYSFDLKYQLPIKVHIDTFNIESGRFSKYQTYKVKAGMKEVNYFEGVW